MDLRAVRGDITRADVDVIVNAANPGLFDDEAPAASEAALAG